MFEPRRISHDQGVEWATRSAAAISKQSAVAAFVASLSRRRLDLRSALGSYATSRHLSPHTWSESGMCPICGLYANPFRAENLSERNFERLKWGGVGHRDPIYAGFDLEQFQRVEAPEPTAEDRYLLAKVLTTARELPAGSRARNLEKGLQFLKSNKSEREVLVQILGYLGILDSGKVEGFRLRYVPWAERPDATNDWGYPAFLWRGGVNEEAVQDWFGEWL